VSTVDELVDEKEELDDKEEAGDENNIIFQ
jgi:hypothetical protein